MTRRAAVTKVQIARRELALDDEAYRALLHRITGQTSSTACTDAQLGRVLDELKAKGWTPRFFGGLSGTIVIDDPQAPHRRQADSGFAKKARALWISLHQLGEVREPSEAALESFARRLLGVDRLQWADASGAYRLIEALKAMATRAGWDQTSSDVRTLKEGLFAAQEARLIALGFGAGPARPSGHMTDRALDAHIRENARRIHACQGGRKA